jgi:hypothetical protein
MRMAQLVNTRKRYFYPTSEEYDSPQRGASLLYMQEIDRLKVELEGKTQMYEELYDHHFKEHHTPDSSHILTSCKGE